MLDNNEAQMFKQLFNLPSAKIAYVCYAIADGMNVYDAVQDIGKFSLASWYRWKKEYSGIQEMIDELTLAKTEGYYLASKKMRGLLDSEDENIIFKSAKFIIDRHDKALERQQAKETIAEVIDPLLQVLGGK